MTLCVPLASLSFFLLQDVKVFCIAHFSWCLLLPSYFHLLSNTHHSFLCWGFGFWPGDEFPCGSGWWWAAWCVHSWAAQWDVWYQEEVFISSKILSLWLRHPGYKDLGHRCNYWRAIPSHWQSFVILYGTLRNGLGERQALLSSWTDTGCFPFVPHPRHIILAITLVRKLQSENLSSPCNISLPIEAWVLRICTLTSVSPVTLC